MRAASLTAVTATTARAAFCGRVSADHLASGFLSRPLRLLVWLLRSVPGLLRAAVRVGDRFEPGVVSYIPCRTAYVDDAVAGAAGLGIEQVVILGAGYDSRAARLARPRLRFFEVDHPVTQAAKRAAMLRTRLDPTAVPVMVAVDFAADDLEARLREAGFRADRPALFVWEGVTMFLRRPAVESTLAAIARLAAPGSRLVADFNYPRKGTLGCRAAKGLGEPCRFAIAPDQAAVLLGAHGLTVVDVAGAEALRRRYLEATGFERRHRAQPSYLVTAAAGTQLEAA